MSSSRDIEASDVAAELAGFDTGLLSDAVERVVGPRVLAGLRSLSPRSGRVAGRAVTVDVAAVESALPRAHLGARAIDCAARGDVLVVANGGRTDVASWGGLLSAGAVHRGVAGVIVDGACRDVEEIEHLGLPVFCRAAVPLSARGRVAERSVGEPVSVAGVRVVAGDWVVGDASGVVVVPAGSVAEVLWQAAVLRECEGKLLRAILEGEPLSRVLDARYETMLEGAE